MTKRLAIVATVILAMLLSACGASSTMKPDNVRAEESAGSGSGGGVSDSGKDPIVIGGLLSLSGPQASPGESAKNGIELYFAQHNYMIGDRKVELKFEDDEGNPQVGVRKYRQLIESHKADVVLGPLLSNVVYILTEEVKKRRRSR